MSEDIQEIIDTCRAPVEKPFLTPVEAETSAKRTKIDHDGVVIPDKHPKKPKGGVDLSPYVKEIEALRRYVVFHYDLILDDFERRGNPPRRRMLTRDDGTYSKIPWDRETAIKANKHLAKLTRKAGGTVEKAWVPDEPPIHDWSGVGFASMRQEGWSEEAVARWYKGEPPGPKTEEPWTQEKIYKAWWLDWYGRPKGPPGRSILNNLPITPLHWVYWATGQWWLCHVDDTFNPTFPKDHDAAPPNRLNSTLFNPPARFLLWIAQECDERYTADNLASLPRQGRKNRKKRKDRLANFST